MGTVKKRQKWTRRYLQDTAVSLKKGDFNTPSVFSFFKRKRRSEICYFKTAVRLLVFCLGAQIPSRQNNGFFIIPLGGKSRMRFRKRSENFYLSRIIYSFFNKGPFSTHCKSDVATTNGHQAITCFKIKKFQCLLW